MKISNRLKLIASFVDDNSYVIDVGCDHALLDIFLVQNKANVKTIASDVNKGPLDSAVKNIQDYELEDTIEVKLGDGIRTINNQVDTIVIGLPVNMDGTEGDRVVITRQFAEELKPYVGERKIVFQDERLTTVQAERMLIQGGVRREKRKKVIDKVAATIILQSYLDKINY